MSIDLEKFLQADWTEEETELVYKVLRTVIAQYQYSGPMIPDDCPHLEQGVQCDCWFEKYEKPVMEAVAKLTQRIALKELTHLSEEYEL